MDEITLVDGILSWRIFKAFFICLCRQEKEYKEMEMGYRNC